MLCTYDPLWAATQQACCMMTLTLSELKFFSLCLGITKVVVACVIMLA